MSKNEIINDIENLDRLLKITPTFSSSDACTLNALHDISAILKKLTALYTAKRTNQDE